MSVGIFIDGRRPKSKKEIKEVIATGELARIELEGTSFFGDSPEGSLADYVAAAVAGEKKALRIDFVGPDPYNKRNFYGNIFVNPAAGKVTVK